VAVPLVEGESVLSRFHYPKQGLDLLAGDQVLAICLNSPAAPPLPIYRRGRAGSPALGTKAGELRVGMAVAELDRMLAQQFTLPSPALVDPATKYDRFYPSLGLLARFGKDNKVIELVIAQVPY
jgi:hypothetical protein